MIRPSRILAGGYVLERRLRNLYKEILTKEGEPLEHRSNVTKAICDFCTQVWSSSRAEAGTRL